MKASKKMAKALLTSGQYRTKKYLYSPLCVCKSFCDCIITSICEQVNRCDIIFAKEKPQGG